MFLIDAIADSMPPEQVPAFQAAGGPGRRHWSATAGLIAG